MGAVADPQQRRHACMDNTSGWQLTENKCSSAIRRIPSGTQTRPEGAYQRETYDGVKDAKTCRVLSITRNNHRIMNLPDTRASLILRLPDASDVEAWNEFVEIYRPIVYRVARKKGLQHAEPPPI